MRKQIRTIKEGQSLEGILNIVTGCLTDPSTSSTEYGLKLRGIIDATSNVVNQNLADDAFLKTLRVEIANAGAVVRDIENIVNTLKSTYGFQEEDRLFQ